MGQSLVQMIRQGFPCLFKLLTGLYCPGCGGTRAVRALLHGEVLLSLQYHPLVLYTVVVTGAELLSLGVARAAKNPRLYLGHETLFVYIAVGIVIINWAMKNVLLLFFGIDLLPLWHGQPSSII